jgi:hypothetical protein
VAVAIDSYFSAQEGYLAKPPDEDGVSYLVYARASLLLLRSHHVRTALHVMLTGISPLWVSVLTAQQLILGDGTWQAFSARFWAVAPLLVLIYWIVSRRATRSLAIAAVILTALLPLVSAGVRSSSWEFLSGQSNYFEHWWLEDVRPDLFTVVLVLWSVAVLAEHIQAPSRSAHLVSAAFATAAVLSKTSTTPIVLGVWAAALGLTWLWNRRSPDATRMAGLAVGLLAVVLIPWALFGGGLETVLSYLKDVVAFQSNYAQSGGVLGGFIYFPVRIPTQLGQIEAWPVIAAALLLTIALLRRRLGPSEMVYAAVVPLFYIAFTLSPSKNAIVGEWISLSIWIFFWAGAARLAAARWPGTLRRASPAVFALVGTYTLVVYALGAFSLANWPANEQNSNAQLSAVTADVAHELARHVSPGQCFTYLPGPGWPNSLLYLMMGPNGLAPSTTASDVDPSRTTVGDYVASASNCAAVMAYREDLATVSQVFFAPAARRPYLQGVADWVRSPNSGYSLDRTWRFTDLAPSGLHALGHYRGVSLTVDLYLRSSGT